MRNTEIGGRTSKRPANGAQGAGVLCLVGMSGDICPGRGRHRSTVLEMSECRNVGACSGQDGPVLAGTAAVRQAPKPAPVAGTSTGPTKPFPTSPDRAHRRHGLSVDVVPRWCDVVGTTICHGACIVRPVRGNPPVRCPRLDGSPQAARPSTADPFGRGPSPVARGPRTNDRTHLFGPRAARRGSARDHPHPLR